MPLKRITIMDVAREAGVDYSTVSLALRKSAKIKAETRHHIEAVAQRLGYLPNRLGRSLARGKSMVIGVMLSQVDPYFSDFISELQRIGEPAGYTLSIHFFGWDVERERQGLIQFCEDCVDGIVWAPSKMEGGPFLQMAESLRAMRIPAVTFGLAHQAGVPCHQVGVHADDSLRLGIDHLLRLGHRAIGLATPTRVPGLRGDMHRSRFEIFRTILREKGLPLREEHVFATDDIEQGGIDIAAAVARLPRAGRPTAIFAANDSIARGLAKALPVLGIPVPGEISLLGFDVHRNGSNLATVRVETSEVARRILDLLLKVIDRRLPASPPQVIVIPNTLVEGGSCRPLSSR